LEENFIAYQLKNIGDALMCLPALGLIKREIKNAFTTMVVRAPTAPLLEGIPFVDEVLVTGHDTKKWSLSATLTLRKRIAKRKHRVSFGFDHKRRSGILSLISGERERLSSHIPGYEKPLWPWRVLEDKFLFGERVGGEAGEVSGEGDDYALALSFPNLIHMTERQGRLVAGALGLFWKKGMEAELKPPMPSLSDSVLEKARSLLKEVSGSGPYVGFCLRGLQPEKSFPIQKAAYFAKALRKEKDARLFLIGLASDKPIFKAFKALSGEPIADFTGRTSLMDLLALGTMTELFVSVDTGASHLFSLAGAPLICVYTASNPAMWAPLGDKRKLLCYTWATQRYGLPKIPPPGSPLYETHELVGQEELMSAARALL
jgi:ADP-heptose:LPS heptosyltransferase